MPSNPADPPQPNPPVPAGPTPWSRPAPTGRTAPARPPSGQGGGIGGAIRADPLAVFRRIVPRDRALLRLLAEHYLLSTPQIAAAFFDTLRTAQRRLTTLHRLGLLHRFAYPNTAHTAVPYLYTLGPVGLQLHPDAYDDPDGRYTRAPRTSLERARRIAASATAAHLLGVNQFFIDLLAATRLPNPGRNRLVRWWSEQHATDVYAQSGIRPDGHGIWHSHDHTVGFFLEHDRGTEDLPRVVAKLRAYARLTAFGPRYPVLLWLPTPDREANLHRILHSVPTPMPVATAVHSPDPAGRVWTLITDLPASPGRRRRLHELPSEHGPRSGTNPGRYHPDTDLGPAPAA
ncbi:replication-relaxation family protein [Dactylosporangium sp. NPDC000244]|uniref:replication-relaxation family protein n=1 Tax=Dactylosporangium sp. NPDC000244 TaxID=3154365 RepID=UPI00332E045E